jgi:O-antigen ligase
MALGLALCYVGQTLEVMAGGLLLFGVLALLRPDLALLLVPLSAPLFLTPLVTPTSGRQSAVPPHELALLVSAGAAFPHLLTHGVRVLKGASARLQADTHRQTLPLLTMDDGRWTIALSSIVYRLCSVVNGTSNEFPQCSNGFSKLGHLAARYAPEALLLIAGVAGIWMAVPEPQAHADALRAFRWFIAEPLIFVALIRSHARWPAPGAPSNPLALARRLLAMFVLGGAAVALLGLSQFAGYLLHIYSAPIAYAAGGGLLGPIERVTSVYGNPNNMALYLGRVWPLAAAIAISDFGFPILDFRESAQSKIQNPKSKKFSAWLYLAAMLLCLGGIVISLSRGAWLGAGAALLVLLLPAARQRFGGRRLPGALLASAIVVAVGALIFALRGGPLGGSADVRILFWRESIRLLELRPLCVGLDQFYYYHYPAYGRSLIDPVLANTQERYARQPHNLLFEIWFNLGPLGAIAFGWLLARCWRRARAASIVLTPAAGLLVRGAIAALAAALVHGLVDSFYFWPDIAIAFWLLVGVIELIEQYSKAYASRMGD